VKSDRRKARATMTAQEAGSAAAMTQRRAAAVGAAVGFLVALLLLFPPVPGQGQATASDRPDPDLSSAAVIVLPRDDLFLPLLASPREPHFLASFHWAWSDLRDTRAGAVAFGENFGIVRWPGPEPGDGIQIGLSGGVFAQFDMETESFDLMNADYLIGVPLTWRRSGTSARIQVYHQSSHLGDEFLLRERPQRINLSFEALEALASWEPVPWRLYGGGEVIFRRMPRDLKQGVARGGLEYRRQQPLVDVGGYGIGRVVAGVDVRAWEHNSWKPTWSVRAGLRFAPADEEEDWRGWGLLLHYLEGPSPYGQFYTHEMRSVGVGIHLRL
jgi:hypothetical protein